MLKSLILMALFAPLVPVFETRTSSNISVLAGWTLILSAAQYEQSQFRV